MRTDRTSIELAIKAKIVEIVASLGSDASGIESNDVIPATGLIDSAGLIELLAWYEDHYKIPLTQDDITIDNLGTISLMAAFVERRKAFE